PASLLLRRGCRKLGWPAPLATPLCVARPFRFAAPFAPFRSGLASAALRRATSSGAVTARPLRFDEGVLGVLVGVIGGGLLGQIWEKNVRGVFCASRDRECETAAAALLRRVARGLCRIRTASRARSGRAFARRSRASRCSRKHSARRSRASPRESRARAGGAA